MGIDQFVVCKIVVEGLAIELIDVGVASFVIGVALFALKRCRAALAAMKSPTRRPIGRYLLMAIKA